MTPSLDWLADPTVFQVNRLDAHSDHLCFASAEELERGASSLRQPLDGLWRFAWSKRPAARPADFWREDFDDSDIGAIQVPGHMEHRGACVQEDHIVVPDEAGGIAGGPVLFLRIEPALGLHIQLLPVELPAHQHGAPVDLAELALFSQRSEIPPDSEIGRAHV